MGAAPNVVGGSSMTNRHVRKFLVLRRERVEVLKVRRYKAGYEIRTELLTEDECGFPGGMTMKFAYTPEGYYIGDSRRAYRLTKRGIKPQPREIDPSANGGRGQTCSIGFCEREQKWFAWSHRAIFGFGVGSRVKEGDCAYVLATPEELYQSIISSGWHKKENVDMLIDGVRIKHEMVIHTTEDPETGELGGFIEAPPEYQTIKCGRGGWIAETLDDAKEMAEAFAESVS